MGAGEADVVEEDVVVVIVVVGDVEVTIADVVVEDDVVDVGANRLLRIAYWKPDAPDPD